MKSNNAGPFNFIKNLIDKLELKDLPPYYKFNLICTAVVFVVVIVLGLQPVLSLIENIIRSIGNIIITCFSDREIIEYNNEVNSDTFIRGMCFLCGEIILCMIFCAISQYINNHK